MVEDEDDRATIEEIIQGTADGSIDYVGLTADSAELIWDRAILLLERRSGILMGY